MTKEATIVRINLQVDASSPAGLKTLKSLVDLFDLAQESGVDVAIELVDRSARSIGAVPGRVSLRDVLDADDEHREKLLDKISEEIVDNSEFSNKEISSLSPLLDILNEGNEHRPNISKELPEEDRKKNVENEDVELTARGTPRVRRKYRTREEIDGDPQDEKNKLDVKLGGRVSRELRDRFVELANDRFPTQSAALTEAIREFLQKHGNDLD